MKSLWNVNLVIDDLSFPVILYCGIKDSQPKFVQIDTRDNNRIRLSRLNSVTFEEIEAEHLGKAYEHEKSLIPVPADFTARFKPAKSDSLVFNRFVPSDSIPLVHFESFYFIHPQAGFESQYLSLYESMVNTKFLGVAEGYFRNLSHLFCLSTYDNSLILYSLRYAAQILPSEAKTNGLAVPATKSLVVSSNAQLKSDLNDRLSELSLPFDPSLYSDNYAESLVGAILSQLSPAA